ncbi:MAG: hypothetical protein AAGF81_19745 [Pseudomonadota bacterium]
MLKKTALGIAAAAAITVTALSGTATTAQAGNWSFSVGVPYYGGHGFYGGHYGYRNPCRHWKRKWRRTGRHYFLRRYRRCMRYHY